MNIAILEETRGRLRPAEQQYKESLAIAQDLKFTQLITAAHANLSNLYLTLERFVDAQMEAAKSVEVAESLGDRQSEALALENLALAHQGMGNDKQAQILLRRARAIARQIGQKERLLSIELSEIERLLAVGKSRQTLPLLRSAEKLLSEGNFDLERPRFLRLNGWARMIAGKDPDSAGELLREALLVARTQRNRSEEKRIARLLKSLSTEQP